MRRVIEPQLSRPVVLASLRSRPLTYAAEMVRDLLLEEIAAMGREGVLQRSAETLPDRTPAETEGSA